MIRVFLDTSALYAAVYSQTGAAREIIRLAIRGEICLVVSQLVLEEARRNLQAKAPEAASHLEDLIQVVEFETVRPTREEVLAALAYTEPKDAPIVAAAEKARVDYLVSFDRRHLVSAPEVARRAGLRIVLPETCLEEVREGGNESARGAACPRQQ